MQPVVVLVLCCLSSLVSSDSTTPAGLSMEMKFKLQERFFFVAHRAMFLYNAFFLMCSADCFECWDTLCNPDALLSTKCSCDCVKYAPGGDKCTDIDKYEPDTSTCCMEAIQYLKTERDQSLTPVSTISGQCSVYYNQPADENIARSTYRLLPTGRLFLIDAIEFECEGCIQSVSLYLNQSTNVGDFTGFTLLVWQPHTLTQSSSAVFVARDTMSLTFDSQPVMWNNIYRAESAVDRMLCFKPGDRLGVNIPLSFSGKILVPSNSEEGVTYMQPSSVCHELNELVFFEELAKTSQVPLIDVTIVTSGNL